MSRKGSGGRGPGGRREAAAAAPEGTRVPPAATRPRIPWIPSLILVFLVAAFCAGTRWGRTYPTFARKTWVVYSAGRLLTAEQRRLQLYDETYPVLLYVRESTPPSAVILMPPVKLIDELTPGDIPVMASAVSAYSFLYPRVPVHWGLNSPWRDRIDHILVWNHWGLDLVRPGEPPTEDNRIALYPWPAGKSVSW